VNEKGRLFRFLRDLLPNLPSFLPNKDFIILKSQNLYVGFEHFQESINSLDRTWIMGFQFQVRSHTFVQSIAAADNYAANLDEIPSADEIGQHNDAFARPVYISKINRIEGHLSELFGREPLQDRELVRFA
jgi:hypothetical protein